MFLRSTRDEESACYKADVIAHKIIEIIIILMRLFFLIFPPTLLRFLWTWYASRKSSSNTEVGLQIILAE